MDCKVVQMLLMINDLLSFYLNSKLNPLNKYCILLYKASALICGGS